MLALLAKDLADVPERFLETAISEIARKSKWMPKASELIEITDRLAIEERVANTPRLPAPVVVIREPISEDERREVGEMMREFLRRMQGGNDREIVDASPIDEGHCAG